jgi:hypothetical protein
MIPLPSDAQTPEAGQPASLTAVQSSRSAGRSNTGAVRKSRRRPLPDAQAISTFSVPDVAPPYDDDAVPAMSQTAVTDAVAGGNGTTVTGTNASSTGGPSTGGPSTGGPGTGRPSSGGSTTGGSSAGGPSTGGSSPHPSPAAGTWPSQFAQVLSETLAGSRPASQLAPWTTKQARERISKLGPMLAASQQPRVRRVIVTSPASGVLEMTVIVDVGSRSRAVAVRLERPSATAKPVSTRTATSPTYATTPRPATWLCTAVEAA